MEEMQQDWRNFNTAPSGFSQFADDFGSDELIGTGKFSWSWEAVVGRAVGAISR